MPYFILASSDLDIDDRVLPFRDELHFILASSDLDIDDRVLPF